MSGLPRRRHDAILNRALPALTEYVFTARADGVSDPVGLVLVDSDGCSFVVAVAPRAYVLAGALAFAGPQALALERVPPRPSFTVALVDSVGLTIMERVFVASAGRGVA